MIKAGKVVTNALAAAVLAVSPKSVIKLPMYSAAPMPSEIIMNPMTNPMNSKSVISIEKFASLAGDYSLYRIVSVVSDVKKPTMLPLYHHLP